MIGAIAGHNLGAWVQDGLADVALIGKHLFAACQRHRLTKHATIGGAPGLQHYGTMPQPSLLEQPLPAATIDSTTRLLLQPFLVLRGRQHHHPAAHASVRGATIFSAE